MTTLNNRTLFITGASRGIGKAIALRAARDGANIVVASKTDKPHQKLPGTIHSAADEIIAAGGQALALRMDVRDEQSVTDAVSAAVERFGGIDILVNNASAINLTGTLDTPARRFDLMFSVNVRGTFITSQACLPHLLQSEHAHILNLAPPLNLDPRWFRDHVAYTMAKYGMSMCVLGMAAEFEGKVRVNALWPRTVIATAALKMIPGIDPDTCRKPDIMADAAHYVLTRTDPNYSGHFLIDENVLRAAGVTDFDRYAVSPGTQLAPDLFLD
ncbi:MAG: NAD(P)-dependent oxidoreductase [Gammaproteobacteria bacterium]|nr:NAD(P)-dependent oxidoreductase [Gammaproteobacteria bacterium]NND59314.1 NAD(P)-dependent oxidoreductase [Gammaproteobacteria bacterium]